MTVTRRLLVVVPVVAPILAALIFTTAVLAAALVLADHEDRLSDIDDRVDRLEHPAPVVRSQGARPSRPTSTTTTVPHVVARLDGACVTMSPTDARRLGAAPDPICTRSRP